MKSPKVQNLKFKQTIEEGSWELQENRNVERHDNETVTIQNEWTREFKQGKSPKQILKTVQRLILRAAEYAEIMDLEAEIKIGDSPPEIFSHTTNQSSEFFKKKSWK